MYRKWYHSYGLKKTYTLYGIENVGTTDKIAIVEGPSCVWRLDQFDIPAVAVLGKSFSQRQFGILKSRGVTRIFLLTDEDGPGKEFRAKFIEEWHNVYQIYVTTLPKKDVSEMSDEQIKNTIVKKWEKI
jgi:DNA primase